MDRKNYFQSLLVTFFDDQGDNVQSPHFNHLVCFLETKSDELTLKPSYQSILLFFLDNPQYLNQINPACLFWLIQRLHMLVFHCRHGTPGHGTEPSQPVNLLPSLPCHASFKPSATCYHPLWRFLYPRKQERTSTVEKFLHAIPQGLRRFCHKLARQRLMSMNKVSVCSNCCISAHA